MQAEKSRPRSEKNRQAETSGTGTDLTAMCKAGMYEAAGRVAELYRLDRDDPSGDPPPNAASLRAMTRVLLGDKRLQRPHNISISNEGFFTAEWTVGKAELTLVFSPTGRIWYAASNPGSEFRVGGTTDEAEALKIVEDVVSQIPN